MLFKFIRQGVLRNSSYEEGKITSMIDFVRWLLLSTNTYWYLVEKEYHTQLLFREVFKSLE